MKRVAGFVLLAMLPAQSALAAAEKPCITRAELHAGITYFLPTVVDGLRDKCATSLPSTSYFATRGKAMVDGYKALSKTDSPELMSLMAKMGLPPGNAPAAMGKPIAEIASIMVNAMLQEKVKPDICPTVDQAFALLDPLPAANMVGLIELFVDVMSADDAKKKAAKPFLCPVATKAG
jgi:hypothetical protein